MISSAPSSPPEDVAPGGLALATLGASELTTVGLMVVAPDGRIAQLNQWLQERWRGGAKAALGQQFEDAIPAPQPARLLSAVKSCRMSGQPSRLTHYLNKTLLPLHHPLDPDSPLAQTLYIQAVDAPGGRGVLIEVLDVTIEADREAKLRGKIGELARANANLEIFSSAASHDLKAPLRAMQVMSSWIEHEIDRLNVKLPDAILDALTRINRRAGQMSTLLDDLLTYCRLDAHDVATTQIAPRALALEALEVMGLPPEFRVRIEDPMPELYGNPAELSLCLRNLIANAARHHDRGEGEILISGGQSETASWISVTDDGPGLDPEDFERVFEPFVSRSKSGGSGLGLAMVRRMAHNRGGEIRVQSPIAGGRGACFTLSLPKARGDQATTDAA